MVKTALINNLTSMLGRHLKKYTLKMAEILDIKEEQKGKKLGT